ncbi:MAG TPA: ChbG/HpnK family deacetylase [Verrucomicrobiae bacterium]|nr:ChbG/HpnK family deacetylase [Verrucomicrobiae bacterium]
MNDREVVFIADDFGMSPEVNRAIVHAHRRGALHGASLMMGQPATEDAVRLARENPGLQVGWHLHLCDSQPITRVAWPWGESHSRAGWAIGLSSRARRLMRDEVRVQWELFQATGLPCPFVNSHHHLHAHPFVYSALLNVLPSQFKGWIRLGKPRFFTPQPGMVVFGITDKLFMEARRRRCPYRHSDTTWGLGRTFRMQAREVVDAARQLTGGLHEFYFHPRTVNNDADVQCLLELKACES